MDTIRLIVGLGNPGEKYRHTRHNVGFLLLDEIAKAYTCQFRRDKKFFGDYSKARISTEEVHLLKPMTFMNRSGQAVAAICHFFKISQEQTLVIHDELDFNPGVIRLKKGGGHGGHNGLRDIHKAIGNDYYRLRIGIGHPDNKHQVVDYVLKAIPKRDVHDIDSAIASALTELPGIITGDHQRVMNRLH